MFSLWLLGDSQIIRMTPAKTDDWDPFKPGFSTGVKKSTTAQWNDHLLKRNLPKGASQDRKLIISILLGTNDWGKNKGTLKASFGTPAFTGLQMRGLIRTLSQSYPDAIIFVAGLPPRIFWRNDYTTESFYH